MRRECRPSWSRAGSTRNAIHGISHEIDNICVLCFFELHDKLLLTQFILLSDWCGWMQCNISIINIWEHAFKCTWRWTVGIVFVSVFDDAHVSMLRFNKTSSFVLLNCVWEIRRVMLGWQCLLVYHKSIYTSNMLWKINIFQTWNAFVFIVATY